MKAPEQPKPAQLASAQAGINSATAAEEQAYGMTNQTGPGGSKTYSQTGMRTIPAVYGANGKVITPARQVPMYTEATTLTPEQQGLYNQQQEFDKTVNQIGIDQAGRLGETLSTPFDGSNEATEARINELSRTRLDPIWEQRTEQMQNKLRNQGLQPGSPAYDRAMASFDYGKNDSYNSMLLQGRAQSLQEAIQQRNQGINETTALMGAQQMQLPQFGSTPSPGVQGVDYSGMAMNNYNQQVGQQNAFMGGLAGLGGAAIKTAGGWYDPSRTA